MSDTPAADSDDYDGETAPCSSCMVDVPLDGETTVTDDGVVLCVICADAMAATGEL